MFEVEIGGLSYQSLVEELKCIVWVSVGWFVIDIVGCKSSLFEGMECGDFGVGMSWHKRCVVVWFECDGMFVGRMKMVGALIGMCTSVECHYVRAM